MQTYLPVCEHCRSDSHTHYRRGCEGCTARRARIAAEHNKLTPAQVAGADSMFQTLPETTK
jgi:hypothetical protein